MNTQKKRVKLKNTITTTGRNSKSVTSKPSWKKLKRKLREKSEADGIFQDGDYCDDEYELPEIPIEEED